MYYMCGWILLVGWLKLYMFFEILGVFVFELYLEKVLFVNKFIFFKLNKDLWEGDEEKKIVIENCVLEDKMDI